MFERYTEKARRVIFFARYEASQFGSPYIETEHLLLGLLREDKALTNRFLRSHASVESIRKQIEGHTTIREKVSTSVDLPLSNECKRVLAYAAEEAERLSHKHIVLWQSGRPKRVKFTSIANFTTSNGSPQALCGMTVKNNCCLLCRSNEASSMHFLKQLPKRPNFRVSNF